MKLTVKKILQEIEDLGWQVEMEEQDIYRLGKHSPLGQDFSIQIDTEDNPEYFIDNIFGAYEFFDVSYETYLWLDCEGHGINGAPYDMKDVYDDMDNCRDVIYDLWKDLADKFNIKR